MKKLAFLSSLFLLAMNSCTNEDLFIEEKVQNEADITVGKFTVSANDYESEDSQTRSAISRDLKFSWRSGDAIGVFPETGGQMKFPINGGENSNTATFDGNGWKLDASMKYAAYYPFDIKALGKETPGTSIPVSYSGQKQLANGSTSHLGKYDYMVATSMSPNGNSINFDFEHVGSILSFDLPVPAGTYSKLSLVAPEPAFTNSGTLDVFTGELTPAALGATISMELGNITVSADGTLKVWMMIAPADLSCKTLKLFVEDKDGKEYKITDIQGTNFIAGSAYKLSSDSNTFSEVTYATLIYGPTFNETIKSLANNGIAIGYGDPEANIKKIIFDCNSIVTAGTAVGDGIYANYDNKGTMTISTVADKISLNEYSHHLFRYLENLEKVENLGCVDTHNVENMGWLFCDCISLPDIDISNFDTRNVTSMYSMFSGCKSLSSLDISSFDTKKVENMSFMFSSCAFESLDLDGFNTCNVTNMEYMFYSCNGLTNLDLSSFNTSNVTDMNCMFNRCWSLRSLDLSNFDTSNVTDMNCMFVLCRSITSLDLGNFDTSNVTAMSFMFQACSNLAYLDISSFDTGKVTDMSFMFQGCESITSLDLSNFDTRKVDKISGMFWNCFSLANLDINGFETGNVDDLSYMFYNCENLASLDLSNFDTSNVTDMNSMFWNCSSLTLLTLGSNFIIKDGTNIEDILSFVGWNPLHCTIYGPSRTIAILNDPDESGVNLDYVNFVKI